MGNTWLVLDCPFLAYRADAVMSDLSHDEVPTSVVFGLMRDLIGWKDLFRTNKVVFCFDRGRGRRQDVREEYKRNRREELPEEERLHKENLRRQTERLMEYDLFELGYRNVLWEEGLEADDIIASVVMSSIPEGDEAIIIGNDGDLFQLLQPHVSMFDPRANKRKTLQWFNEKYGVMPSQWADVKALAGCSGDNVKGVKGVGEKSAIAFLTGNMGPKRKRYESIMESKDLWTENLRLVQLPFEGTPVYELREDKVTRKRWEKFCEKFGMKTIRGLYPGD